MPPQEVEKADTLRNAKQVAASYDSQKAKAEKQRQSDLVRQQVLELGQRKKKPMQNVTVSGVDLSLYKNDYH